MKIQIASRQGFTLMEIMVVIIVIAVLASVAGPMIGSITDQGRASATKSKLASLKSALLSYSADVGRFPYVGDSTKLTCSDAYNTASLKYLHNSSENNVLVSNEIAPFNLEPYHVNYQRRYKGPYMDANPEDFMHDGWGNFITYFATGNNVYLRSNGINGENEAVADALNAELQEDGTTDDIMMSVTRTRKKFDS